MIAFAAALLCLAWSQEPALTWQSVPNADKKVTLKLPLTTLADVATELRKQTEIKIRIASIPETKLTILVRDMKVSDLLEEIADTAEVKLNLVDGGVSITDDRQARQSRNAFLNLEDQLLQRKANARLDALVAALPTVTGPLETAEPPKTEDLQAWARRKVRTPAGYAAALARRAFSQKGGATWVGTISIDHIATALSVTGYVFEPLPQKAKTWGHRGLDSYSAQFEGCRIIFAYSPVYGSWRVKGLSRTNPGKIDDDPKLLVYPRPPKELASQPYANNLALWTKGDSDSKLTNEKITPGGDDDDLLFPTQGPTLADHLNWLHLNSKVNIVATAFRFPSGPKLPALTGDTVGECLQLLTAKTDCFVSISKRCVRVRPAGYWRLAVCEPAEASVRRIEAAAQQRELTLDDYGDFASGLNENMLQRFEQPDWLAANFDQKPLLRGAQFLKVYGRLDGVKRRYLLNGGAIDIWGKPYFGPNPNGNGASIGLTDAAVLGSFGDVAFLGRYIEILECPPCFSIYLDEIGLKDIYWDKPRIVSAAMIMRLAFDGADVGILFSPNDRDGVLFWLRTPPPTQSVLRTCLR